MNPEQIKQELEIQVKKLAPIGKKLKLHLGSDVILVDGTNGENCIRYMDEEAECTISMSLDTYKKVKRREIKPMTAALSGKINVKGDITLLHQLKHLL